MVKYYGRAKQITGTVNTNQIGLNMSGCPSKIGHQGYISIILVLVFNNNLIISQNKHDSCNISQFRHKTIIIKLNTLHKSLERQANV